MSTEHEPSNVATPVALPIRAARRRAAEIANLHGHELAPEVPTVPGKPRTPRAREARIDLETTARMGQSELVELVRLTSGKPRRTSEMQRPDLIGLLRHDLELGATPAPADEQSDRVIAIPELEPTDHVRAIEHESRLALGVAFLAAVVTGVLLTIPFW